MVFDAAPLLKQFEAGREQGLHTGLQIHVRLHGEVLLDEAWGEERAGVSLQTRALMLWMSSGKPLLAAGLALLKDGRKLDWEDPVVMYLPEFGVHDKQDITLRHLLTHTGGFRQADLLRDTDWDALVAKVCAVKREPGWTPGGKAGYHSAGSWVILGEVVRRITGRMPGPWLREHLFLPLGMTSTWLGLPADSGLPVSLMHTAKNGVVSPHPDYSQEKNLRAPWPGSNIFSTARDMAEFYTAMLKGGGGVLTLGTAHELVRAHREGLVDQTFKHPLRTGLGFLLDSKRENIHWHSYGYGRYASANTFGHGGNQSSVAFADPACSLVVAAAYNTMPGELSHQGRMRELLETIYEEAGLTANGR